MDVTCPHCQHSLPVALSASVPDEQRMEFVITSESELLLARTLGGVLTDLAVLLRAVDRDMGAEVQTFVEGIDMDGKTTTIRLVLINAKRAQAAEAAPQRLPGEVPLPWEGNGGE